MPKVKRTDGPKAPATAAHNGGITQAGPGAPTAGTPTPGGPITASTTGTSDFKGLGWFTVDGEGCTVQFGIEPQQYVLAATSPNYNAMFSTLLTCWAEGRKVRLTFALPLLTAHTGDADGPLRIVSLLAL